MSSLTAIQNLEKAASDYAQRLCRYRVIRKLTRHRQVPLESENHGADCLPETVLSPKEELHRQAVRIGQTRNSVYQRIKNLLNDSASDERKLHILLKQSSKIRDNYYKEGPTSYNNPISYNTLRKYDTAAQEIAVNILENMAKDIQKYILFDVNHDDNGKNIPASLHLESVREALQDVRRQQPACAKFKIDLEKILNLKRDARDVKLGILGETAQEVTSNLKALNGVLDGEKASAKDIDDTFILGIRSGLELLKQIETLWEERFDVYVSHNSVDENTIIARKNKLKGQLETLAKQLLLVNSEINKLIAFGKKYSGSTSWFKYSYRELGLAKKIKDELLSTKQLKTCFSTLLSVLPKIIPESVFVKHGNPNVKSYFESMEKLKEALKRYAVAPTEALNRDIAKKTQEMLRTFACYWLSGKRFSQNTYYCSPHKLKNSSDSIPEDGVPENPETLDRNKSENEKKHEDPRPYSDSDSNDENLDVPASLQRPPSSAPIVSKTETQETQIKYPFVNSCLECLSDGLASLGDCCGTFLCMRDTTLST
ncbi:MAG: hypothetical protein AAF621_02525 [Pseudomonadota bacterium]